jgi:uncharacterized protein YbjT (DUF2867 family)
MQDNGDEIQEAEAVEVEEEVRPRAKKVPLVRTRNPGKVNRILEGIAQMFKDQNPGMACRWVYHPEHKRELSNVIARRSEGYQHVRVDDLGEDAADLLDGDEVRVGDVVLMKISRVEREELVEELAERAHDQASSVEVSFYEGAGENQVTGPDGTVHEARPRGHATIEEKDYIFDVEQRTSE